MKKTTKLISLLLAVVLVIGIVPLSAGAVVQTHNARLDYHFDEGDKLDFSVPSSAPFTATVTWKDKDGQVYPAGWSARTQDEYHAFIMLTPKSGYEFADDIAVVFNGLSIQHNAYNNDNENTYCWKEMSTKIELHVAFRYLSADTFGDYSASISTSMRYNDGFYIKKESIDLSALAYDNSYHFDHWSVQTGTARINTAENPKSKLVMGDSTSRILSHYKAHHLSTTVIKKAGFETDGEKSVSCNGCAYVQEKTIIPKANVLEREDFSDGAMTGKVLYYNGKNQHIGATLWTYSEETGEKAIPDSNYDIIYPEQSKNVGTYTARIVLTNEYEGESSYQYSIYLGKPAVTAKAGVNAVALSWKKVPGATAYRIYGYNLKTKKYTRIADTKALSYVCKGRAAGTAYTYLVRAYFVNKAGKEVLSPFSVSDNVNIVTLCSAPRAKAAVSGKTVVLKWAKVAGAKAYRVYKYNTKTKKYTTVVSATAKTAVKLTKQPKGNNYYLVRAFNAAKVGSNFTTKNLVKAVVKR